jgi:hypothetical protein
MKGDPRLKYQPYDLWKSENVKSIFMQEFTAWSVLFSKIDVFDTLLVEVFIIPIGGVKNMVKATWKEHSPPPQLKLILKPFRDCNGDC